MNPNNYNPSERTYTYAEMLLNQAATVREEAARRCEWCARKLPLMSEVYPGGSKNIHQGVGDGSEIGQHICDALDILAIPTDQLALDRHDAKLRKTISNEGSEREPCGHFKANLVGDDYGHFTCDACRHDAELKAQTAAMLEKAAEIADRMDVMRQALVRSEIAGEILDLIPTDYAAALAERDKKIHYEGSCWMLDSIRASLQGYPDHGGDIEVMKEVDRIVREAVRTDRENLCSWLAGDPNWPEGKIVAENILTMTAEENALLAAHRAAAGAPKATVVSVDPKKLEVLKVWYSLFTTIMDEIPNDPVPDTWRMEKLRLLRDRLKKEAPGLENN